MSYYTLNIHKPNPNPNLNFNPMLGFFSGTKIQNKKILSSARHWMKSQSNHWLAWEGVGDRKYLNMSKIDKSMSFFLWGATKNTLISPKLIKISVAHLSLLLGHWTAKWNFVHRETWSSNLGIQSQLSYQLSYLLTVVFALLVNLLSCSLTAWHETGWKSTNSQQLVQFLKVFFAERI